MATPLEATMPTLDLIDKCEVRFEAISPTTGSPVAGVKVSNGVLYVVAVGAEETALEATGPFMWVPGPESGVT